MVKDKEDIAAAKTNSHKTILLKLTKDKNKDSKEVWDTIKRR